MVDRYDGDPAILITNNGGDLVYEGGQPLMDNGGLENAVIISLFSATGWVGNALETDPDNMIGSDFYTFFEGAPITSSSIRKLERFAIDALAWLINVGLASETLVSVTALTAKKINIDITIIQKDSLGIATRASFNYDLNWNASVNQAVINTGAN